MGVNELSPHSVDPHQTDLDRSIAHLIFHLSRHLAITVDRQMAPFNLTGQQGTLLLRCCATPDATPTQLASSLGTDNAGITRLLDRLESKELVVRRMSAMDRRAIVIEPTAAGRALVPHLLPVVRGVTAQLIDGFSADELPLLQALLTRLVDNIKPREQETGTAERQFVHRNSAHHGIEGGEA
jgi:DNA-binding MarR family transcriptional regulator